MLKFNSFIVVLLASFCFVSPSAFAETNTITLTKVLKGGRTVSNVVKISASAIKLFCQDAVNPKECDSNADAVANTVDIVAWAARGGGVIAGAGVVGGAGGLEAAHLMNEALYTDCQDQKLLLF